MADEIGQIDLSEFGLDDASGGPSTSAPSFSDDTLPANVLEELGMESFEEQPNTNGAQNIFDPKLLEEDQARAVLDPGVVMGRGAGTSPPPELTHRHETSPISDFRTNAPVSSLDTRLIPQGTPSTGFGILEQILLELTAANLEMRALRQVLSNPGASGPSNLPSAQGAQRSESGSPAVEGTASPTADAPARSRRRGRPKKEDEFGLEQA